MADDTNEANMSQAIKMLMSSEIPGITY